MQDLKSGHKWVPKVDTAESGKKRSALVLRKASGSCSCKDNQGFLVLSVIHFVHFVQTVLLGGCDLSHYRMDASKSTLDFRSGYWTKWIMREKLNLCSPVQRNYIRHVENVEPHCCQVLVQRGTFECLGFLSIIIKNKTELNPSIHPSSVHPSKTSGLLT